MNKSIEVLESKIADINHLINLNIEAYGGYPIELRDLLTDYNNALDVLKREHRIIMTTVDPTIIY